MKIERWVPIILGGLTSGLLVLLIVGSFIVVHSSVRSIKAIDEVQFPILEELALVAQLNQRVEQNYLFAQLEPTKTRYQEYELAVESLRVRIDNLNELSSQVDVDWPSLSREELCEAEKTILKASVKGELSKGKPVFESGSAKIWSQRYQNSSAEFKGRLFQVSSSLSQVRADFLAQKQSDYKQSLTYGLVVLLSIIGCLILFSISFYKQYSRAQHYKAQAITSSKLAALGEMAGGIAHEINNPLAVISGNIDTALMSLESERPNLEKILSRLGKARKTVDRVSNIVKSLKTISRDSSKDKKVEFELKDLVMEAVSLCSEKIRVSGIGLEVKVADGIRVEGNRTELSQVLINLINNSIDAVAEDSYPWLKIGSRPSDNGSLAELHIMDSGNGIPAEIAQDILKPFFTTKPIGQGTGLGLSISHGIVKRHGGNLWLDTKSKNTKFCMSLPAQFNAANKSVLRSA